MIIPEIKQAIVSLYKTGVPIVMYSAPGIGKTDTVKTFPAILEKHFGEEFGLVTVEATAMDAPDVLGFLVPTKDPDTGDAVARYTMPNIMRMVRATGLDHGIVFVDEVGQADHLVQKAFASLFHPSEKRLGEYTLPDGWYVIGASNRVEDRAGAVKQLSHFINRQCMINIEPNIDAWTTWAEDKGLHPMMIGFARFKPGVMVSEVPAKPGAYCTARSLTFAAQYIGNIVDSVEDAIPVDTVTQQVVSGFVGDATAAEMFSFFATRELLPTWEEVLTDPSKAKVPTRERLDACFAAAAMVLHHTTAQTLDTGFQYVQRLPIELQTSTARQLMQGKLKGAALNSPAIGKFISENQALVIASI